MFLDCIKTLLEVEHLGVQRLVSLAQPGIFLALGLDLLVLLPEFQQAATTKPNPFIFEVNNLRG